jgi:D-beta-D-heptose 7-phosphate kinase/D-beta-D-heptose 1-phosphate adenosyltransferase
MIVTREELHALRGTVTLADGGFDPLHPGHVAYLEQAAALGHPLLCCVASDSWVAAKHPPLLAQDERALVLDALRAVAYTYPAAEQTAEVIALVAPRIYAKGRDWEGRLPEEELAACAAAGTDIVFLDTITHSSSALLERLRDG